MWPSSVTYLVTLGWESMASYLDIVWSLFPQICHRVQGRENAWPDPYMVTLGWASVTYLELRGRNWTSICCSKTRHHAMAYSHLHSDPGVSLENPTVGELRQRYAAAQHAILHHTHSPSWHYWVNLGFWENYGWKGQFGDADTDIKSNVVLFSKYVHIVHIFDHITFD